MEESVVRGIEDQVRSAFADGTIGRVQVLEYGDDPSVEPGEVGIRLLVAFSGAPEDEEAAREAMGAFHEKNRAVMRSLSEKLPPFIGWMEIKLDGPGHPHGPMFRLKVGRGRGRERTPDEAAGELTPVMTRLGTADLTTVDTLITAGIASSRAEVLRWAVGRIRENPAYAQIQERVREINELKARF